MKNKMKLLLLLLITAFANGYVLAEEVFDNEAVYEITLPNRGDAGDVVIDHIGNMKKVDSDGVITRVEWE